MQLFNFKLEKVRHCCRYAAKSCHIIIPMMLCICLTLPPLTSKLSKDIERVQRRCLRIIFPQLSYSEALDKSGLNRLDIGTRREEITKQIFRQIKSPTHPLHYLFPPPKVSSSQMILRPTYPYQIPKCKKTRYGKDFIPYCIARKY